MVNFLRLCIVWVVDCDIENFAKICVVSLRFSSFPINMAVVIDCLGHLLLRYSLYHSSARRLWNKSHAILHSHFSFLLILVTYIFLANTQCSSNIYAMIFFFFFITDAKC
jgi:hypothetical protein